MRKREKVVVWSLLSVLMLVLSIFCYLVFSVDSNVASAKSVNYATEMLPVSEENYNPPVVEVNNETEEQQQEEETAQEVVDEPVDEYSDAGFDIESALLAEGNIYGDPYYDYWKDVPSYGILTPQLGINKYNGYKETYYPQSVLPGGDLKIPGRHVAEDGTIRDADGYIVLAMYKNLDEGIDHTGEIHETSLGLGKVYDSGCDVGVIDIYTDWPAA